MDQCDKQKSAIGDHDVFEYPMGNRTPEELRGRDAHQAAAVVKDWLRETHKSYPQTLTNLLSKVYARPLGSCHDKDDPDSDIKVVLSLIAAYPKGAMRQFWMSGIINPNFTRTSCEFKVPRMFCPGSMVGPDESAIGDGNSGDQLWPRHATGVSLCIGGGFATLTP